MSITLRRPLLDMHSRLSEIPQEWLKFIEPKILRGSFLPCWVWTGSLDRNGYPILFHKEIGGIVMAHRFVASMFWDFPDRYFVTRICHRINCLCPGHLVVQEEHPRWAPPVNR